MKPGQSLNELSSNILSSIDDVLEEVQPELVLVHGDTTTSVMVAWAAFHRNIKIGHVEAGLRTYSRNSPFPEEMNRQITARLAEFHFAPTKRAKQNLLKELPSDAHIIVTGNTIVDALKIAEAKISSLPEAYFYKELGFIPDPGKKIILVTGHRRENFGSGFENICEALIELSKRTDIEIVFPVHLNPNVYNFIHHTLNNIGSIHLISPVTYPCLLWLMQKCEFIISDSGGIQEEAPAFRKFVLITREISERMEGIEAGCAILVGTKREKIVLEATKLLKNANKFRITQNPYGDGNAAGRIVDFLENK